MSEGESPGKRIVRLSRPVRILSEALAINKERQLHLATIFTECLKNDDSAVDSILTVLDLRKQGKITEREAAFLIFDFGWFTSLNAAVREINKQIMGAVYFNKNSGEIEDA